MSMVHSYSVGNGDMFSIRHGTDNFTIIDCCLSEDNRDGIIELLKKQGENKEVSRFISTHPDEDHIKGLQYLDEQLPICNFYCVDNKAKKDDETDDFKYYCKLRNGKKAFYIYEGCSRRWMNKSDKERGSAGISVLWPDTNNSDFKDALDSAENGNGPNNISPIITYRINDGASFIWMGDLETDFIEKIEDEVSWPDINILFAPHHGRDSGKIPENILEIMNPSIIVIGEAPSKNLNYYNNYNTITQNSSGSIAFECLQDGVDIYVGSDNYSVDFLTQYKNKNTYDNYIGTLDL